MITITKKKDPILSNYYLCDHPLKRATKHRDLGVLFNSKLDFTEHIHSITSKAFAALGFVKRFCHNINDISTLKSLYFALVQSHLEYCHLIWMPTFNIHIDKVESILKQITMFAIREYPNRINNYQISFYGDRLTKLKMTTLHKRRINSAVLFIFDLLRGNVHCPDCLMNSTYCPTNEL